ncbi:MAG: hypothetical protein AB1540_13650 [Bdellovibrionota bacterium]
MKNQSLIVSSLVALIGILSPEGIWGQSPSNALDHVGKGYLAGFEVVEENGKKVIRAKQTTESGDVQATTNVEVSVGGNSQPQEKPKPKAPPKKKPSFAGKASVSRTPLRGKSKNPRKTVADNLEIGDGVGNIYDQLDGALRKAGIPQDGCDVIVSSNITPGQSLFRFDRSAKSACGPGEFYDFVCDGSAMVARAQAPIAGEKEKTKIATEEFVRDPKALEILKKKGLTLESPQLGEAVKADPELASLYQAALKKHLKPSSRDIASAEDIFRGIQKSFKQSLLKEIQTAKTVLKGHDADLSASGGSSYMANKDIDGLFNSTEKALAALIESVELDFINAPEFCVFDQANAIYVRDQTTGKQKILVCPGLLLTGNQARIGGALASALSRAVDPCALDSVFLDKAGVPLSGVFEPLRACIATKLGKGNSLPEITATPFESGYAQSVARAVGTSKNQASNFGVVSLARPHCASEFTAKDIENIDEGKIKAVSPRDQSVDAVGQFFAAKAIAAYAPWVAQGTKQDINTVIADAFSLYCEADPVQKGKYADPELVLNEIVGVEHSLLKELGRNPVEKQACQNEATNEQAGNNYKRLEFASDKKQKNNAREPFSCEGYITRGFANYLKKMPAGQAVGSVQFLLRPASGASSAVNLGSAGNGEARAVGDGAEGGASQLRQRREQQSPQISAPEGYSGYDEALISSPNNNEKERRLAELKIKTDPELIAKCHSKFPNGQVPLSHDEFVNRCNGEPRMTLGLGTEVYERDGFQFKFRCEADCRCGNINNCYNPDLFSQGEVGRDEKPQVASPDAIELDILSFTEPKLGYQGGLSQIERRCLHSAPVDFSDPRMLNACKNPRQDGWASLGLSQVSEFSSGNMYVFACDTVCHCASGAFVRCAAALRPFDAEEQVRVVQLGHDLYQKAVAAHRQGLVFEELRKISPQLRSAPVVELGASQQGLVAARSGASSASLQRGPGGNRAIGGQSGAQTQNQQARGFENRRLPTPEEEKLFGLAAADQCKAPQNFKRGKHCTRGVNEDVVLVPNEHDELLAFSCYRLNCRDTDKGITFESSVVAPREPEGDELAEVALIDQAAQKCRSGFESKRCKGSECIDKIHIVYKYGGKKNLYEFPCKHTLTKTDQGQVWKHMLDLPGLGKAYNNAKKPELVDAAQLVELGLANEAHAKCDSQKSAGKVPLEKCLSEEGVQFEGSLAKNGKNYRFACYFSCTAVEGKPNEPQMKFGLRPISRKQVEAAGSEQNVEVSESSVALGVRGDESAESSGELPNGELPRAALESGRSQPGKLVARKKDPLRAQTRAPEQEELADPILTRAATKKCEESRRFTRSTCTPNGICQGKVEIVTSGDALEYPCVFTNCGMHDTDDGEVFACSGRHYLGVNTAASISGRAKNRSEAKPIVRAEKPVEGAEALDDEDPKKPRIPLKAARPVKVVPAGYKRPGNTGARLPFYAEELVNESFEKAAKDACKRALPNIESDHCDAAKGICKLPAVSVKTTGDTLIYPCFFSGCLVDKIGTRSFGCTGLSLGTDDRAQAYEVLVKKSGKKDASGGTLVPGREIPEHERGDLGASVALGSQSGDLPESDGAEGDANEPHAVADAAGRGPAAKEDQQNSILTASASSSYRVPSMFLNLLMASPLHEHAGFRSEFQVNQQKKDYLEACKGLKPRDGEDLFLESRCKAPNSPINAVRGPFTEPPTREIAAGDFKGSAYYYHVYCDPVGLCKDPKTRKVENIHLEPRLEGPFTEEGCPLMGAARVDLPFFGNAANKANKACKQMADVYTYDFQVTNKRGRSTCVYECGCFPEKFCKLQEVR